MEETAIETRQWTAPEYVQKERSVDWFWTIGVLALIGAVVALVLGNYLFAIFILVSGTMLIMTGLRPPREIEFEINKEGIRMGKDTYLYKNIKGFALKPGSPYAKLLIETDKYFLPVFTIPVPEGLVAGIDESLSKVLPEIELNESRSMQMMEKLGF